MFLEYRPDDPADTAQSCVVRLSMPGHAGPVTVDLGDGTTLTVPDGRLVHIYPGPGVYEVTACDTLGRTAATTVTIGAPCIVDDPSASTDRTSPVGDPGDRPVAEPEASPGSATRRTRSSGRSLDESRRGS